MCFVFPEELGVLCVVDNALANGKTSLGFQLRPLKIREMRDLRLEGSDIMVGSSQLICRFDG